ncbi:Nicotinic acid mononucleotide biosynthesis protein [mine drainage metagenome]|uniref:Nicotinic acid mononucleotide biosynthesis protein n=1 Tax=mine drainage metagenome TaxID=410659 RepID=T1BEB5_9ZZZZ
MDQAAHARSLPQLSAELIAVIVAVSGDSPRILTLDRGLSLPSGPLETGHRSLQAGVRSWVERKTHHALGHIEQLYTFADRDRLEDPEPKQVISVSYLGLTLEAMTSEDPGVGWQGWYRYFPWEDHRSGRPSVLGPILDALEEWARSGGSGGIRRARSSRVHHTFGAQGEPWNEEWVLQRYELLYEAGLVEEAQRREHRNRSRRRQVTGESMQHDHRRILATGIARLRAKIKYRPVVFELLPEAFTYLRLQKAVEALAGRRVHKQNFRRLIAFQKLVEPTGGIENQTGGRPARLYRFRRAVLQERMLAGSKLPLAKSK